MVSGLLGDEYYYDARTRPQLGDAEHAAAILRRHPRTPDVVLADGANLRYEFTKLGAYARTPIKDFEETIGHLGFQFPAPCHRVSGRHLPEYPGRAGYARMG